LLSLRHRGNLYEADQILDKVAAPDDLLGSIRRNQAERYPITFDTTFDTTQSATRSNDAQPSANDSA
jgi:hypothetical protein